MAFHLTFHYEQESVVAVKTFSTFENSKFSSCQKLLESIGIVRRLTRWTKDLLFGWQRDSLFQNTTSKLKLHLNFLDAFSHRKQSDNKNSLHNYCQLDSIPMPWSLVCLRLLSETWLSSWRNFSGDCDEVSLTRDTGNFPQKFLFHFDSLVSSLEIKIK